MSLQSDSRSSLEELKRRNSLPPESPATQTGEMTGTAQSGAEMVSHPTTEEWRELHRMLWAMGEMLGTQTVILEELSDRLPPLAGLNTMSGDAAVCRSALEQMRRDTETIRKLLERETQERKQAGRRSEKRFSFHWPDIPLAPFEPGWLFLPFGLVLLLGLLLISVRLWSGLSVLFT